MIPFTSLGSRLTLWYVLIIMGTVTAVFVTGRILLNAELLHGVDLLNEAEFHDIQDRVDADGVVMPGTDLLKRLAVHAKIDAPFYFFQVRDASGEVRFRSDNMRTGIFPQPPKGVRNWNCNLYKLGDLRVSSFPVDNYQLEIATSLKTIKRLFHYYDRGSIFILTTVAVLSLFFGHQMSRLALNPIRHIQQTASRISAENLKERIPVAGVKDEISDLGRLLNQMFDRLEKSFGRLSRFAGEASHELKTPLSIIRLQSEKLILHGNLSASQQDAVQQQLESINGLNLVIEKLLFIARSEVGDIRLKLKRVSSRVFIDAFVEDALVLCEDRGITFTLTKNDDVLANFDSALLRQVLLNLLSNAVKSTPAGGRIMLSSTMHPSIWKVTVEDTGTGLAEGVKGEELFKPFGRRNSRHDWNFASGNGLGLTICRSILELHHGTIRAENQLPESGLRVIFEVPLTLG